MTWVVWRQHRAEGLIVLAVLAVLGVFLLITGEMAWNIRYGFLWDAPVLVALQLLLGALVGAPLLTREVEQRTHLLIWTQSITRTRWLAVTLPLVLGAGLLASGALLAGLSWWHDPWAQYEGSFGTSIYDTSGPVWVATTGLSL